MVTPYAYAGNVMSGLSRTMKTVLQSTKKILSILRRKSQSLCHNKDRPVDDATAGQQQIGTLFMLNIGDKAPTLTIPTDTGQFSLAEQGGKKVVVFFFPRADTSGCTKESIQFSALGDAFAAENTVVIGVSKDTPTKQAKFREKHGLTCLLGADHETDFCERFGVWVEKSMYGKRYMGIQRASFVIDVNGTVAAVWPKVKVDGHAEEVLTAVKAI
jgi:peroxiredoxin Q/BCP